MALQYLERSGKPKLAYHYTAAPERAKPLPVVVFLGGFKSDMNGTKATFLEQSCIKRSQGFLRFDYSGHGQSEGKFEEGTIGLWKKDALDIIDHLGLDHVLLVGSSMGGWIGLLLLLELGSVVRGMVGIAAAPDFTKKIWEEDMNEEQRQLVNVQGYIEEPNDYDDEPYIFTKALFEDGQNHLLLDETRRIASPVSLIQGMKDSDVPWEITAKIQNALEGAEIDVILIDDGDHRLSRPEDLDVIEREVISLSHFQDE